MSESNNENASLIGTTLDHGRYEIVKLIGEGGMGRVFKARQVSMDRMVAMKVLRAQMATDPQLLARFQQEALSVSRLRHPNTITYFDYGRTEDDRLFIAMELLGGQSLFSLLRSQKRLPLPRALHIIDQVVGAVAEAHRLGVVHRDLKPENIQIDEVAGDPDFVKVLDFGIAKIIQGDHEDETPDKGITLAGTIFGTPHYMSPEQVHGKRVDHRTDIYSIGVILYELLAGDPPFDGATPMAVMMAQASKPVPDIRQTEADLTPAVADLVTRCLSKERDDRVPDADTLLSEIRSIRASLIDRAGLAESSFSSVEQMRNTPLPIRPSTFPGTGDITPAAAPRQTPAPSIDSQADALRTPEHIGHLTVPPMASEMDLEPVRTNSGALIAAVLIGVLGVGGLGFWLSQDDAPPEKPIAEAPVDEPEVVAIGTAQRGAEPPKEKVLAAEPDAEAQPVPVELLGHYQIVSEPEGASVLLGEDLLGKTPFVWKPAVGKDPVALRFELDGHGDLEHALTPEVGGDDATVVTVKLEKKRRVRNRPKPKPKPREPAVSAEDKPPKVEAKPKPKPKPKPEPKPKDSPYKKLL